MTTLTGQPLATLTGSHLSCRACGECYDVQLA